MASNNQKLIAVIGATGQQGGSVVRALQAGTEFTVRALTRNPARHRGISDQVVEADLDQPGTLVAAFRRAHGVFLVTNSWEKGTDEFKQATAAIRAAKDAGVRHFIWSTLPDVEAISGGTLHVPHFTGKARNRSDRQGSGVCASYVRHRAFLLPEPSGRSGSATAGGRIPGLGSPIDPDVRGIHMGDITEIGKIVAGAFAHPDEAGRGEYLPLVGDFMSFNEIIETLNQQGHNFSFTRVPNEVFATLFPGAADIEQTFRHFQAHTYLGSDSRDRIALANTIAGGLPTKFSPWARVNVPLTAPISRTPS